VKSRGTTWSGRRSSGISGPPSLGLPGVGVETREADSADAGGDAVEARLAAVVEAAAARGAIRQLDHVFFAADAAAVDVDELDLDPVFGLGLFAAVRGRTGDRSVSRVIVCGGAPILW